MESDKKSWASEILRLYFRNRYSPETEKKIQKWLIKNPDVDEKEQASKEFWDSISTGSDESAFHVLKKVNSKIGIHFPERKVLFWKTFSRVAAIFVLLISLSGIWLYIHNRSSVQMISVQASYGETRQIILPDKSVVWLNAGSLLSYPTEFNHNLRVVSLEGEAFFSVTKDESSPFVVKTDKLSVKVLGTEFNLKAYRDDKQTVATLKEGKIEVQTADRQLRQLVPNEQLTYNNQTSILKIEKIVPNDIPDWENGKLFFANASLDEILLTLKRRFNVSFEFDKSFEKTTEHYTIKFERNETLEQILTFLEDVIADFSYSKVNGQIILHKK
jgi:transmembrane sensor